MAYTTVTYLKQLMDHEILPFLRRVLRSKQYEAMDFYVKARDYDVHSAIKSLIVDDSSLSDKSYEMELMSRWVTGSVWEGLLTDIESTMNDLDGVNCRLEGLGSHLYRQQKFAYDILTFNLEMKEVLTFYKQSSYALISFLTKVDIFLDESNNNDIVKHFRVAVDIASHSIKDIMSDRDFHEDYVKIQHISDLFQNLNKLLDDSLGNSSSREGDSFKGAHQLPLDHSSQKKIEVGSSSLGEEVHDSGTKFKGVNPSHTSETKKKNFLGVADELEDIVVGRDYFLGGIIDELTRPPMGLTVVRIVGMGGIGKTTMAKKVFHHPSIVLYFHRLAWVNIGSNVQQVLSDLLYAIQPFRPPHDESIQDKGESLWKSLKGRKYLIVVDNLWDFHVWGTILKFFPDDKNGSRILITTRVVEFPTSIGTDAPKNPPHCFGMRFLNEAESWELLERKLFGKERCPFELVQVGKQISEKCGGLPLTIVLIAGTLLNLPKSYISWLSVLDNITAIVSANPESCLDIVALSYTYLPHHLKPCFLLMGAFPSNYEIRFERLIRLWMADGFFNDRYKQDEEKDAENCLKELISRSLVSVSKISLDGKIKACLVHDIVRQLCLREAQKEKFMHVIEGDGYMNVIGLEEQRHLIFTVDDCANVPILPTIRHLRSYMWLTMGTDFTPGMVLLQLPGFKWLRVLDIYFLPFGTFPEQIADLVNLRYLALNVTELSPYLYNLYNLQTLIIYGPWITSEIEGNPTLQLEFTKMCCLSHVNVMVPVCLDYPSQTSMKNTEIYLFFLQTLSSVTFSSPILSNNTITLKKLGISETKPDYKQGVASECFRNLSAMKSLNILKCCFYRGNKEARNLSMCDIPSNLKKLTLSWCCSSWEQMKHLAKLQNLETLKLKNNAIGGLEWLLTEEVVFPALKQLLIDNSDLVHWDTETYEHFPCLKHLVLRYCDSLVRIPAGVAENTGLELIELHSCSESAEASARDYEEQNESPQVVIRAVRM